MKPHETVTRTMILLEKWIIYINSHSSSDVFI